MVHFKGGIKMVKKKVKIFEFVLIMTIFFICLFSIGLKSFLHKNDKNLNNLKISIENEWKENIHADLTYIQDNLQKSINDNTISSSDDGAITKIVLDHLSLNNKDYIKSFSIINIGYSKNDGKIDMNLFMNDNDKFSKESIDDITNQFKHICIDNISSEELQKNINEIAFNISEKYDIEYKNVKDFIINSLFEKNKMLFSTSENKFQDNDGTVWLETITIPNGELGFKNEPEIRNNEPNLLYKKILIIACIDSNVIMQPFNDHCRDMKYLIYIIYFSFSLIMILFMIITFSYFIKIIKSINGGKDSIGGGDSANVCKSIRSIFNNNVCINDNGIRKSR